jgi:hypothetical protein
MQVHYTRERLEAVSALLLDKGFDVEAEKDKTGNWMLFARRRGSSTAHQ